MYNIPNYKPANNPFLGKRPPKVDPPPVITDATKATARRQGATHLSKDGRKGYMRRYGDMYESNEPDFQDWLLVRENQPAESDLCKL